VLLLASFGMASPNAERRAATAGYVFLLSVVGLAAVFYFGYASFFVLGKLCLFCATFYVSGIGLFLAASSVTTLPLVSLPGRLARDLRAAFADPLPAGLSTVWIVASVLLVLVFPRGDMQAQQAQQAQEAAAPVETLAEEQLLEWHAWIDKQPRVDDVQPADPVKVLLVKFNDYQCPSCRMTWIAYRDIIDKYRAMYPGVFSFETRDFPLEPECGAGGAHGGACEGAVAVRLAREKGRGSEMETWLYQNQAEMSRDRIERAVREIAGVEDFDARYPKVLPDVRKDVQLGQKLEVSGTPTFFLNGVKMPSVRAAHLDAAIAYELQKAGVAPAASNTSSSPSPGRS
jgi:protein-disulfide isomerase